MGQLQYPLMYRHGVFVGSVINEMLGKLASDDIAPVTLVWRVQDGMFGRTIAEGTYEAGMDALEQAMADGLTESVMVLVDGQTIQAVTPFAAYVCFINGALGIFKVAQGSREERDNRDLEEYFAGVRSAIEVEESLDDDGEWDFERLGKNLGLAFATLVDGIADESFAVGLRGRTLIGRTRGVETFAITMLPDFRRETFHAWVAHRDIVAVAVLWRPKETLLVIDVLDVACLEYRVAVEGGVVRTSQVGIRLIEDADMEQVQELVKAVDDGIEGSVAYARIGAGLGALGPYSG